MIWHFEQEHTAYNDGRTCNCVACVEKRGFILTTMPHKEPYLMPIFFKREKPEGNSTGDDDSLPDEQDEDDDD